MKYILALMVMLAMFSCTIDLSDIESKSDKDYTIVVIDGCEYIKIEVSLRALDNYSISLTHKGNCNNPIHKYETNDRY